MKCWSDWKKGLLDPKSPRSYYPDHDEPENISNKDDIHLNLSQISGKKGQIGSHKMG